MMTSLTNNTRIMPKKLPELDLSKATIIKTEDAKKALEADVQGRIQACSKEVKAICDKYRCTIVPIYVFQGNQVQSDVKIQALP